MLNIYGLESHEGGSYRKKDLKLKEINEIDKFDGNEIATKLMQSYQFDPDFKKDGDKLITHTLTTYKSLQDFSNGVKTDGTFGKKNFW